MLTTQVTLTIYARFSELQAEGTLAADMDGCSPLITAVGAEPEASIEREHTGLDDTCEEQSKEEISHTPPYGMPCMYKVLEFFCQLTNPGESPTDAVGETRRMLGLSLVNIVLETGGRQLSVCPALVSVIQHDLSRNLLQNSRTTNLQILSATLRVVFNMFNSVREHMKVQLEVFFNSIHLAESSVYEIREMALESLVEFCREPQLMVDIYTNYDCDVQCTNLFEDMCKFLSKNTFPLSGSLNALNLLALEGLLAIVGSLAESCEGGTGIAVDTELTEMEKAGSTVDQLRLQKQHKKRLALGAEQFNRNHKKGIEFLQSIGLLPEIFDPKAVATFFRTAPGLDRIAVGVYLGEPDEANLKVLQNFAESFSFGGMGLAQALKAFLAGFRLPGEAQKIARIVEAFAAQYYSECKGPLKNADTAYVLAYAVIMLNTDLHNPQVKKKMTREDFVRMNRGINDGDDLPFDFLSGLYDNISREEIKMKDEISDAATIEGDNKRWTELLRGRGAGKLAVTGVESVHTRDMFLVVWDRIISALSVVFETTEDEKVLKKTLEGLHKFASICSHHRLHDEFNKVVLSMSKSLNKFAQTTESAAVEEEALWVFVRHPKVQQAAQAMFKMGIDQAGCLREGWTPLLEYLSHLHRLCALPAPMIERDDFVDLQGRPLGSSAQQHHNAQNAHETASNGQHPSGGRGLLSFFFGGSQQHDSPRGGGAAGKGTWTRLGRPGSEALTEFVKGLRLEELFGGTKFLAYESLSHLVQALIHASSRCVLYMLFTSAQNEEQFTGR